jgi:hypothetical protein
VRVVCPYTQLHPEADAALTAHAPNAERIDVSRSDMAYGLLLLDLWWSGEPFCIIEHDVVIGAETLPRFEGCPEPWCVDGTAFECVRFRSEKLRPDLFADQVIGPPHESPLRWDRLSNTVDLALYDRGERVHQHEPRSTDHLNAKARER